MLFLSGAHALGRRVRQPIVSVAMGAIGTALAMTGMLIRITDFLNIVGSLVVPLSFVVFIDLLVFKNKGGPKEHMMLVPLLSVFAGSAMTLLSSNASFCCSHSSSGDGFRADTLHSCGYSDSSP